MVSANTCSKCGNKIISGVHKYQGKFFCAQCYEQVMEEVQRFEEEKQKLDQSSIIVIATVVALVGATAISVLYILKNQKVIK